MYSKIEMIRAKQAGKPKHGPLPELVQPSEQEQEIPNEMIERAAAEFEHYAVDGQSIWTKIRSAFKAAGIPALLACLKASEARIKEVEAILHDQVLSAGARVCDTPWCDAAIIRKDSGSRVCAAGHPERWVDVSLLRAAEQQRDQAQATLLLRDRSLADAHAEIRALRAKVAALQEEVQNLQDELINAREQNEK